MDPVTAFGLACNVVQVTAWSIKTISTIHEIYKQKGEATQQNVDALQQARDDSKVCQQLATSLQSRYSSTLPANESQLLALATECSKCGLNIEAWLTDMGTLLSGNKLRRIYGAVRVVVMSGKVKELQDKLSHCQSRLQTGLLVNLW